MNTTGESGSKTRTRSAIIDAAIRALNEDPQASMAGIAAEAQVGRTTLHRYFPERSDLMEAVASEGIMRFEQATKNARLEKGTAFEALQRLCYEYMQLSELLRLIFNGSEAAVLLWEKWGNTAECSESDRALAALVERGHREKSFNPQFTHEWVVNVWWSMLYASVSYIYESHHTRHETLELMTKTLESALKAPTESRL